MLNKIINFIKSICAVIRNPEPFYRASSNRIAHWLYNPCYTGFEKIPETGGVLVICNHVSFVDGLVVQAGINRPVRFVIDGHIYNTPIVHYFMKHGRAIPILPNRKSVTAALDSISEALEDGDVVCIFPEGEVTYTGGLSRFRPGVEYIVQRTPVPVYPLAITGLWGSIFSRKYLGKWHRFLPIHYRQNVRLICGDAISPKYITRNMLQTTVLRLKYLIQAERDDKGNC